MLMCVYAYFPELIITKADIVMYMLVRSPLSSVQNPS